MKLGKPFTQRKQMTGGCIAKITQGLVQHNQQQMQPFIGIGLGHAKGGGMRNLKRGYVQIAQQEQQAVFGCGERRIDIGGLGARRPRLPLHCPRIHMAHKRLLKGFNQLLELFDGEAGQVQDLVCFISLAWVA